MYEKPVTLLKIYCYFVSKAMTDLIENKARQLEHDAKNLEDEDDSSVQIPPSKDIVTTKASAKKPANYNDDKNDKSGPGIVLTRIYKSMHDLKF